MIVGDYTIPEAEVIYQKAVIRGAWWFLAFLMACVVVYFVVRKIVEDREDARAHQRKMARIKESADIEHTGAWAVTANRGNIILKQKKYIAFLDEVIEKQAQHIIMLENTLDKFNLGDIRDNIRQQMEQQTN